MRLPFHPLLHSPEIDSLSLMCQLFESLPDVYFFAKDTSGRFLKVNRIFAELCGKESPGEVEGKTDWDLFPAERASMYLQDDQQVMETKIPITNRIEPSPVPLKGISLMITTKLPLRNASGEICGMVGIARDINRTELALRAIADFQRTMEYIQHHYDQAVSIPALAQMEGMSLSQFERRFKATFHLTPSDYIQQVRIRHACRLLIQTRESLAEIALHCGFFDQSHFSHSFRRALGIPPLHYRKRNQQESSSSKPGR